MTQEQRDAWCNALRSGEYRQGEGALRRRRNGEDQYCCMGVLCDVIAPDKWDPDELGFFYLWNNNQSTGRVPVSLIPKLIQGDLIGMNDTDLKSFAEIADWIEQNVEVTP